MVRQSFLRQDSFFLAKLNLGLNQVGRFSPFLLVVVELVETQRSCNISSRFFGAVLFLRKTDFSLDREFAWQKFWLVVFFFGDCQSFYSEYNLVKMDLVFVFSQFGRRSVSAPNTACTRLVGVCAFSGSLRGLKLVPSKWRYLVPPTSG